jgi:hypothetical protein
MEEIRIYDTDGAPEFTSEMCIHKELNRLILRRRWIHWMRRNHTEHEAVWHWKKLMMLAARLPLRQPLWSNEINVY